ncbi:MAG TPA: phage baseplate assembly protein V [Puia sp.]|jgi:Rhs element Vgr protein|nr:phage baseplate assembly protein V [Puia sp.]
MAQFVDISIDIDGKNIKQFSSLSLSQAIFDHHAFRLVCPTEAIDGTSGSIFNSSKDMMGGSITIRVNSIGSQGTFQFSGVVTQIDSSRHSGHAGDVIISGFSPTILLDNGPHCKTWEKKAIKNIAQDVVQQFPQNLLQPKIAPSYGETLAYTTQYKETAWQFLCRLSTAYGEWLLYDGQKLILGPPQGSKAKLIYGSNLESFDMAMQVRPASFEVVSYDYLNHQVYDGKPAGIEGKAGLNDLGKHALQKSEQFYGTQPKFWHNQFLTNKKQLDDFVNAKAVMQSSNMIRFHGNSGQPGIQLGGTVSVQGKNIFNQSDESFGDYTVISVNHYCDGQGNYSNNFISIPASLKMPPVSTYVEPRCETQSALVTDNNDQKGLGRIRVKFHWMSDDEKSPWLRITSPHGGDGKGMFFIPEVGEEVIVGFEGDSPSKPYIIGTVYNGNAKTTFSNSGNDVKALQTRSGNMLIMNDNEGSIHVADAKGNDMKMDGSGNINISSSESIVLTCGNSKIEMKKDGTININGKQVTTTATDKAVMTSGQASFTADGQQNEADMAGMKANVSGTTETNVKGLKTTVSADTEVDINANAQVAIKSSAMVAVKGAIITLN